MTPNEFYQQYGQHIYQPQQRLRRMDQWPYIFPTNNENINLGTVVQYGYHFGPITAVYHQVGQITVFPIIPNMPAISYQFAGCFMAKFSIGNQWYISHIHSGFSPDKRRDFYSFYLNPVNRANNLTLFKPTTPNDYISSIKSRLESTDLGQPDFSNTNKWVIQICGLITPNNRCYSICMDVRTCMPYFIIEMDNLPLNSLLY